MADISCSLRPEIEDPSWRRSLSSRAFASSFFACIIISLYVNVNHPPHLMPAELHAVRLTHLATQRSTRASHCSSLFRYCKLRGFRFTFFLCWNRSGPDRDVSTSTCTATVCYIYCVSCMHTCRTTPTTP